MVCEEKRSLSGCIFVRVGGDLLQNGGSSFTMQNGCEVTKSGISCIKNLDNE